MRYGQTLLACVALTGAAYAQEAPIVVQPPPNTPVVVEPTETPPAVETVPAHMVVGPGIGYSHRRSPVFGSSARM